MKRSFSGATPNNAKRRLLSEKNIFVFDTERTGLNNDYNGPNKSSETFQIAGYVINCCVYQSGGSLVLQALKESTINHYMMPKRGIPEEVVDLTGFSCENGKLYREHGKILCKTESMKTVYESISRELSTVDVVCAHNGSRYDFLWCMYECASLGIQCPLEGKAYVDTVLESGKALKRFSTKPITGKKLGGLYEFFVGNIMQNAHDALADVDGMVELFFSSEARNDRHAKFLQHFYAVLCQPQERFPVIEKYNPLRSGKHLLLRGGELIEMPLQDNNPVVFLGRPIRPVDYDYRFMSLEKQEEKGAPSTARQLSEEWFLERQKLCGTGSMPFRIKECARKSNLELFYADTQIEDILKRGTVLKKKAHEDLEFVSKCLNWGRTNEMHALECLSKILQNGLLLEAGLNQFSHGSQIFGASPDGIWLMTDGKRIPVELKCPYAGEARVRIFKGVKAKYLGQLMMEMQGTESDIGLYCAWCPDLLCVQCVKFSPEVYEATLKLLVAYKNDKAKAVAQIEDSTNPMCFAALPLNKREQRIGENPKRVNIVTLKKKPCKKFDAAQDKNDLTTVAAILANTRNFKVVNRRADGFFEDTREALEEFDACTKEYLKKIQNPFCLSLC